VSPRSRRLKSELLCRGSVRQRGHDLAPRETCGGTRSGVHVRCSSHRHASTRDGTDTSKPAKIIPQLPGSGRRVSLVADVADKPSRCAGLAPALSRSRGSEDRSNNQSRVRLSRPGTVEPRNGSTGPAPQAPGRRRRGYRMQPSGLPAGSPATGSPRGGRRRIPRVRTVITVSTSP